MTCVGVIFWLLLIGIPIFLYLRKNPEIRELRRKRKGLQRKLERLRSLQASIADAKAGRRSIFPSATSIKEVLKEYDLLRERRENLFLQSAIVKLEKEIEEEVRRIREESQILEAKLKEELSLEILSPRAGEEWKIDQNYTITWKTTGPIGEKLRIELWKAEQFFRQIALSAATAAGTFSWRIPSEVPPDNDYRIRLIDRETGLEPPSGVFKITS